MSRLTRTIYFVLALGALAVSAAHIASAGPDEDAQMFGIALNALD